MTCRIRWPVMRRASTRAETVTSSAAATASSRPTVPGESSNTQLIRWTDSTPWSGGNPWRWWNPSSKSQRHPSFISPEECDNDYLWWSWTKTSHVIYNVSMLLHESFMYWFLLKIFLQTVCGLILSWLRCKITYVLILLFFVLLNRYRGSYHIYINFSWVHTKQVCLQCYADKAVELYNGVWTSKMRCRVVNSDSSVTINICESLHNIKYIHWCET